MLIRLFFEIYANIYRQFWKKKIFFCNDFEGEKRPFYFWLFNIPMINLRSRCNELKRFLLNIYGEDEYESRNWQCLMKRNKFLFHVFHFCFVESGRCFLCVITSFINFMQICIVDFWISIKLHIKVRSNKKLNKMK